MTSSCRRCGTPAWPAIKLPVARCGRATACARNRRGSGRGACRPASNGVALGCRPVDSAGVVRACPSGLDDRSAANAIARVLGQVAVVRPAVDDFAVIRALARLGPELDYPDGLLADAYHASERLACECHADSGERDAAIALERHLRASDPMAIDPELLAVIRAHWT